MAHVKVSIIVPVYNVEKYLRECMESLVNQTLDDIEIIAINDGSPDNSIEILEEYKEKYPEKVVVRSIENRGVSYARNLGIQMARGSYVMFVDSDDYIEKQMCEMLYNKAVSDDNDLVICNRYNIRISKNGERIRREIKSIPLGQNFDVFAQKFENIHISPFPWDKLYKREILDKIQFDENIRFEDFLFIHKQLPFLKNIGTVEVPLYNYRKENSGGFLNSFSIETFDIIRVFERLIEFYKKNDIWEYYYDELEYLCIHHFYLRNAYLFKPIKHKGKKELQYKLVDELSDFLEEEFPNWENNHYLRYSAPGDLKNNYKYYFDTKKIKRYIAIKHFMPLAIMKWYDLCCRAWRKYNGYSILEIVKMRKQLLREAKLHVES